MEQIKPTEPENYEDSITTVEEVGNFEVMDDTRDETMVSAKSLGSDAVKAATAPAPVLDVTTVNVGR